MIGRFLRRRASRIRAEKQVAEFRERYFEGADTTRLNSEHWRRVLGSHVNHGLIDDLETIRNRCEYEAANNAIVAGVIATHENDVVGPFGPSLQIRSGDPAFDEAAEQVWRDWWAMPDIAGVCSGADFLKLLVRLRWSAGEWLTQLVTFGDASDGVVRLRLNGIHPRRIASPMGRSSADRSDSREIVLGVERSTRTGRPLRYWIDEPNDGEHARPVKQSKPIDAGQVIHYFEPIEPGQVRGVPLLASSLPAIADLRDFDAQVLDAMRQAADHAAFIYTTHPDAPFLALNTETEVERRVIKSLPPGYQLAQMTPQQPHVRHIEYRADRYREIGRVAGMPLMTIRLDSSGHNYSSARFDGQVYQRTNRALQGRIEARVLNRLVAEVLREAELAGAVPRRGRGAPTLRLTWTWPVPPHVDPQKEANASTERLANGTTTMAREIAANGLDFESVVEERAREAAALRAAGLPVPWETPKAAAPPAAPDDDEQDDQADDGEQPDDDDDDAEVADRDLAGDIVR